MVVVPALIALALAVLASLHYGLTFKERRGAESRPIQERGTMLQATQMSTDRTAVPPIDAAARKDFETATFALG